MRDPITGTILALCAAYFMFLYYSVRPNDTTTVVVMNIIPFMLAVLTIFLSLFYFGIIGD